MLCKCKCLPTIPDHLNGNLIYYLPCKIFIHLYKHVMFILLNAIFSYERKSHQTFLEERMYFCIRVCRNKTQLLRNFAVPCNLYKNMAISPSRTGKQKNYFHNGKRLNILWGTVFPLWLYLPAWSACLSCWFTEFLFIYSSCSKITLMPNHCSMIFLIHSSICFLESYMWKEHKDFLSFLLLYLSFGLLLSSTHSDSRVT